MGIGAQPSSETHRLAVDRGIDLVVHDFGGDGEPLLFAHANGFHGRVWAPLVAHLPGRRCLTFDFRGFGDSTAPTETIYDWQQLGDDVLAVVAEFGLTGGDAVGHSMGGAALLIAELTQPGTFRQLFVYEPIVPPPSSSDGGNALAELTRHRRTTFDSVDDAMERYATKATLGTLSPECLLEYVDYGFDHNADGSITLKASPEHEARHYEGSARRPVHAHLAEIGCPTTVAYGNEGFPAMLAPMVADRLPNAELVYYETLGHFGPLEDPALVAQGIRDALS